MKKIPIDSNKPDELVSGPRLIRKRRTQLNVLAEELGIDAEGLLDSILINYLAKNPAALRWILNEKEREN